MTGACGAGKAFLEKISFKNNYHQIYTEPNKDIPRYYIDYYKTSYLEEGFWGIQNAVIDLTSYDQLNKVHLCFLKDFKDTASQSSA